MFKCFRRSRITSDVKLVVSLRMRNAKLFLKNEEVRELGSLLMLKQKKMFLVCQLPIGTVGSCDFIHSLKKMNRIIKYSKFNYPYKNGTSFFSHNGKVIPLLICT